MARNEMEDAIRTAMFAGWSFRDFIREAKEMWVGELREEAYRVETSEVQP